MSNLVSNSRSGFTTARTSSLSASKTSSYWLSMTSSLVPSTSFNFSTPTVSKSHPSSTRSISASTCENVCSYAMEFSLEWVDNASVMFVNKNQVYIPLGPAMFLKNASSSPFALTVAQVFRPQFLDSAADIVLVLPLVVVHRFSNATGSVRTPTACAKPFAAHLVTGNDRVTVPLAPHYLLSNAKVVPLLTVGPTHNWIPERSSPFVEATVVLDVNVSCNDIFFTTVRVNIPVAPLSTLRGEVTAGIAVATHWASIAGVASGTAVGRVAAVAELLYCGEGPRTADTPANSGLLGLAVSTTCSPYLQGAVIGNTLLLLSVAAVLLLVGCVASYTSTLLRDTQLRQRFSAVRKRLAVPLSILSVFFATLPSTVIAVVHLLAAGSSCATGVVTALFGAALCLVPSAALAHALVTSQSMLQLQRKASPSRLATPSSCWGLVEERRRVLCNAPSRWVDVETLLPAVALTSPHRGLAVVLSESTVLWYPVLDMSIVMLASALSALADIFSPSMCFWGALAVAVLYGAQLLVVVVCQPFRTLLGLVFTSSMLLLSTVSMVALTAIHARSGDSEDLQRLADVVLVSEMCISAVVFLRTTFDAPMLIAALKRALSFDTASNIRTAGDDVVVDSVPLQLADDLLDAGGYTSPLLTLETLVSSGHIPSNNDCEPVKDCELTKDVEHEDVRSNEDHLDRIFWDEHGNAVVQEYGRSLLDDLCYPLGSNF